MSHYAINSATLGIQGNRLVGDASLLWSSNLVVGTVNIMNPSQAQSDQFNASISGPYGKLAIYSSFTQRTSRSRERELSRERASAGTGGKITGCVGTGDALVVGASTEVGGLVPLVFICMILSNGK